MGAWAVGDVVVSITNIFTFSGGPWTGHKLVVSDQDGNTKAILDQPDFSGGEFGWMSLRSNNCGLYAASGYHIVRSQGVAGDARVIRTEELDLGPGCPNSGFDARDERLFYWNRPIDTGGSGSVDDFVEINVNGNLVAHHAYSADPFTGVGPPYPQSDIACLMRRDGDMMFWMPSQTCGNAGWSSLIQPVIGRYDLASNTTLTGFDITDAVDATGHITTGFSEDYTSFAIGPVTGNIYVPVRFSNHQPTENIWLLVVDRNTGATVKVIDTGFNDELDWLDINADESKIFMLDVSGIMVRIDNASNTQDLQWYVPGFLTTSITAWGVTLIRSGNVPCGGNLMTGVTLVA